MASTNTLLFGFFLSLVYLVSGQCVQWNSDQCTTFVNSNFQAVFDIYGAPQSASNLALTNDITFIDAQEVSGDCKNAMKKALCLLSYKPCHCSNTPRVACKAVCDDITAKCNEAARRTLGLIGDNVRSSAAWSRLNTCTDTNYWGTSQECYNGSPNTLTACPSSSPSTSPSRTPSISISSSNLPAPPSITPSSSPSLGSSSTPTRTITASVSISPSSTPSTSISAIPPVQGDGQVIDLNLGSEGGKTVAITITGQRGGSVVAIVDSSFPGYTYTISVLEGKVIRVDCAVGGSILSTAEQGQELQIFCSTATSKRSISQSPVLQLSFVTGADPTRVVITATPVQVAPSPSPSFFVQPTPGGANPQPAPPAPPAPAPAASPEPAAPPSDDVPPRQSSAPPAPQKQDNDDDDESDGSPASAVIPSAMALLVSSLLALW